MLAMPPGNGANGAVRTVFVSPSFLFYVGEGYRIPRILVARSMTVHGRVTLENGQLSHVKTIDAGVVHGLNDNGLLQVRGADDLHLDGGTWTLTEDQKGQPVARIIPPAVPMFQQVVEYLEAKPVPPGGTLKRDDEARAAVAVCLRWGSYFAVLADPFRPDAPDIADEEVSQIADQEMARMNIEISAALAWWLTLRGVDERRYDDLVHRVLATCPPARRPSAPSTAPMCCWLPRYRTWRYMSAQ